MTSTSCLELEHLNLSDYELGGLVLGLFIEAEAEKQGISADSIPEGFANQIVLLVREIEAEHANQTTLAAVLRNAALGEFSLAGRLCKEEHIRQRQFVTMANLLIAEVRKGRKGPKAGGAKTAAIQRKQKSKRNRGIKMDAERLLKSGRHPRSIAGIIAETSGLHPDTIRRILKNKN